MAKAQKEMKVFKVERNLSGTETQSRTVYRTDTIYVRAASEDAADAFVTKFSSQLPWDIGDEDSRGYFESDEDSTFDEDDCELDIVEEEYEGVEIIEGNAAAEKLRMKKETETRVAQQKLREEAAMKEAAELRAAGIVVSILVEKVTPLLTGGTMTARDAYHMCDNELQKHFPKSIASRAMGNSSFGSIAAFQALVPPAPPVPQATVTA